VGLVGCDDGKIPRASSSLIYIMAIHIRSEQATDAARITEVTELAFRNAAHTCGREHCLVEALRAANALTCSLVAVSDLGIVGHVAASPVTVANASGNWFGIGPISVLPECQKQGIGSQLMNAVLAQLRAGGARGCMLVGDPAFYTRFGFKSDGTLVVPEAPPEVTLNLCFHHCDDHGAVSFHPAFMTALAGSEQTT